MTPNAVDCAIAGGGPAGMMIGVLLARGGVRVAVLEKHADFRRDFRGDTIHPSTLQLMSELGWLDDFLTLPHRKAARFEAQIAGRRATIAEFSHLPLDCPYIVFMPQWDFLNFLCAKGADYQGFHLMMEHRTTGLIHGAGGRVSGLTWESGAGATGEIRAPLVIAADGRHSILRAEARLDVQDFGSAVDVVWFKLSRRPDDPVPAMSHTGPQQGFILIDRGDFWQCAYAISKGTFEELKARGLPAFREMLAAMAPLPAGRFAEIGGWDEVSLLTVRMDRLKRWWVPGLLCIGDAAHAMTPTGGFGINLAIQDAVAAANILGRPLREGRVLDKHLAAVESRRHLPTRATQAMQRIMRRKPDTKSAGRPKPPALMRAVVRFPFLARLMGRIIGMGFRPERVGAGS